MSGDLRSIPTEARWPPENVYGHTKKIRFFQNAIARHRERKNGDLNVLDFGCGSGAAVSQYLITEGIQYYGVDFHPPSLVYARQHFSAPGIHFLEAVPADIVFDVIVYSDLLEHLDDPVGILRQHARQLAPDGIILGSVPNGYGGFENERRIDRFFHLSDILRFLWRGLKRATGRPPRPAPEIPFNEESGHVQFFTQQSLKHALASTGFMIRKFAHGSFVGADLSGSLFIKGPLIHLNTWLADRFPVWAVSTWHFEAARTCLENGEDQTGTNR